MDLRDNLKVTDEVITGDTLLGYVPVYDIDRQYTEIREEVRSWRPHLTKGLLNGKSTPKVGDSTVIENIWKKDT